MSRAFQLHRREENLLDEWAVTTQSAPADMDLADRICVAYQAAGGGADVAGQSMWTGFMRDNIAIHDALISGDHGTLAVVLADPGATNLFKGFDNIYVDAVAWMKSGDAVKAWFAMHTYDNLLRVLEAVGGARIDNPEHYHVAAPNVMPVAEILDQLDEAFGFSLCFPNPYPDECGLRSDRGVISYRAVQSLYQAWKIAQSLHAGRGSSVVEIGAGLGRTAFFAREFGITDYTIVDLPFTSVSQAHFLGTVISPNAITLTDEPSRKDAIKIITGDEFFNSSETYDLIVNVDSFTEIDEGIARRYWAAIEERTPAFLSINHERNAFTVRELIDGSAKVKRSSRNLYWLRRGYVEELIDFA
jgi:hypothetical protein